MKDSQLSAAKDAHFDASSGSLYVCSASNRMLYSGYLFYYFKFFLTSFVLVVATWVPPKKSWSSRAPWAA